MPLVFGKEKRYRVAVYSDKQSHVVFMPAFPFGGGHYS